MGGCGVVIHYRPMSHRMLSWQKMLDSSSAN